MGIFDKMKQDQDDQSGGMTALKDKAAQMAGSSGAGNAADQGLDKAGQMLDEKTGNKYSGQIDTGVGKAKDFAGQKFGQSDSPGDGDGQAQQQPDGQSQQMNQGQQDPGQQMDPNQQDPGQQMDQQMDQSQQS